MKTRISVTSKIIGLVLLVSLSGCCRPILYKPSTDPSAALLKVNFPKHVETLTGFSAGRTRMKKNFDEDTSSRTGKELKEMAWFFRGEMSAVSQKTECLLFLHYTDDTAKAELEQRYSHSDETHSVFASARSEDASYFVSYVERPRSDPGGLCLPLDYYTQRASFRFGNLVIDVQTEGRTFSRDMLTKPISYIAERFEEYFKNR